MKKTLLALLLLFCIFSYAQQPTRNQLLKLYYEANSALNSDNVEQAVAKYEEIISLTPRYGDPYLRLAQICEQHADKDTILLSKAILMYRMYVNLELDDAKADNAVSHLRVLENKLNVPHYDEELAVEEADLDEYALSGNIPQASLDGIDFESIDIDDEEIIVNEDNIDIEQTEIFVPEIELSTNPEQISSDNDLLMEESEKTGQTVQTESISILDAFSNPYEVEIVKENTKSAIYNANVEIDDLIGRWVSLSRMDNGREAWIIDIGIAHDELRITLNLCSGVLNIPQWQQNLFGERSSLLAYANDVTNITTQPDITHGTMRMISNLQSFVVNAAIEDGRLYFKYDIDLHYIPTPGKYEMMRQGFGALGSLLGGLIGVDLSYAVDAGVNAIENKDTDIHYLGSIDYSLDIYKNILTGTCKETLTEESVSGVHEKKNRVFNTQFVKVSSDYNGYGGNPFVKTKADLRNERKILHNIMRSYPSDDPDVRYVLGILGSYKYGSKDFTGRQEYTKAALYDLRKAAALGSVEAQSLLATYYFGLSLGEKPDDTEQTVSISTPMYSILSANANVPPKKVRKSSLFVAEQYLNDLRKLNPSKAYNVEAEYQIMEKHDINSACEFFEKSGDAYALNRLGEIYLNEYGNVNLAVQFFAMSAENGNAEAMLNIARLYRDGTGVPHDPEAYITWILRSFENGNVNALDELADAYMRGIGVNPDYRQAIKYVDLKRKINYDWCNYLICKHCPKVFES